LHSKTISGKESRQKSTISRHGNPKGLHLTVKFHQFVDFFTQNHPSNHIFSYFSIAATPLRLKKIMESPNPENQGSLLTLNPTGYQDSRINPRTSPPHRSHPTRLKKIMKSSNPKNHGSLLTLKSASSSCPYLRHLRSALDLKPKTQQDIRIQG
jgi:hypothetical protein